MNHLHHAPYKHTVPFNIQFWIDAILIALALTLITNGVWLLIKYKPRSKQ